jgi:hypothetical protein
MPSVETITERVLSGENVLRRGSDFLLVMSRDPPKPTLTPDVQPVVGFINELQQLCDEYFASQDKDRITDYEDIAYVAGQIVDGLVSEYENPALLPLNRQFGEEAGRTSDDLAGLAAATGDYIHDLVRQMLDRPPTTLNALAPIVESFHDAALEQLDLFTLNHDVVAETALREAGVAFSDGFERRYGTLHVWSDSYSVPNRRFFKLHGSIDWYRYLLPAGGQWRGQASARSEAGEDPFHARGPENEPLEYPADGRPTFLAGTFNKILSYPTGIYADQHSRFHEALTTSDTMLIIGYGFRDKAINARIVAWTGRPGRKRLVVVHRDPFALGSRARGAIRGKWDVWQDQGLLDFIPQHLGGALSWSEITEKLEGTAPPWPRRGRLQLRW